MNHLFLPYHLAVLAKEKGFNEDCLAYYDATKLFWIRQNYHESQEGEITAPLYQQIVDWLRTKNISITEYLTNLPTNIFLVKQGTNLPARHFGISYYSAFDKAIEEALNLIHGK